MPSVVEVLSNELNEHLYGLEYMLSIAWYYSDAINVFVYDEPIDALRDDDWLVVVHYAIAFLFISGMRRLLNADNTNTDLAKFLSRWSVPDCDSNSWLT